MLIKGPTLSHIKYFVDVSKWQYTFRFEYVGKLWAIDPYRNPDAPKYILTVYLPFIGEVWLNENPQLKELKGPTLLPVALYNPKLRVARVGSVFSVEIPQNK